MRGKHGATERVEGIDTKLGRLVIPIVAIAAVVVIGAVAPSLVTNAVLASEPASEGTPTPEPTPEPAPTRMPTVPTAPSDGDAGKAQPGGLFSEVEGDPPPSSGVETLASRLVEIDFGQLARVTKPPDGPKTRAVGKPATPQTLVLNLFDDVVFTGIVEHVEPTSSGHVLWGRLDGVDLGTMTLVVNGSVVTGTVRTPDAVYTVRTAGDGAYVIRQIDESSLLPLGEPLQAPLPTPNPSQGLTPTPTSAPNGTPSPTPIPTVPAAPSAAGAGKAQPGGLFSEVKGDPPPSSGVETLASRLVDIDFGQIAQVTSPPFGPKDPATGKPTTLQTLVLNLFDDVVFTGIVEHVEPTSSGHALWGRLDGVEPGTMTLVVNGSVVAGTVRTPGAVYTIRTAGGGAYVIRQIDESSLPPLGEPLEGPLSTPEARSESDDAPSDDGSVIDVMVVYTPDAKHFEGGKAAIEALIDLFVAETNQANANSRVTHRIRLVLSEEVQYIEDGDSFIDLDRLANDSDGYIDHVHDLRDLYAADLVHIVVSRSVNVCGLAHLNLGESSAEDEKSGFALTVSECGGLVFAHELGHNMGLRHDRYAEGGGRGSNFGYVNQRAFEPDAPVSARWRTIMAYDDQCEEVGGFSCPYAANFSNPEVKHNGDPTGVSVDNPSTGVDGPADAVRTLNERREITANFRRSSTSPAPRVGLTLSPYWLSENGGKSTVTATLHKRSSADTTVTVSASPSDAFTLSANRTLTIPAGRTVSRGAVTITGVDNSDQTGDVTVTISATVANASSQGVVEPEPVALAIADDETTPVVTLQLSPAEIVEFEGRTFVSAMLDNRSVADTVVKVSATPAEVVEEIDENTLTVPAGQTVSIGQGVEIFAVDDSELTEAEKLVTVSGTATNSQGVTGPDSVTLTIFDDEAPFFADDSIAYTFTEGLAGNRFLPEAAYGNGTLTYSLSPAPSNGVTFTPGPPARIGTSSTSVAGVETSYTLTVTDADGDTDTMTISITVREGVCPNSAAVSGYSDPEIVDDCEALLASRDTLSVDQSLNWDEDLPIDEWKGVELANGQVVGLRMSSEGIVGTIPSELGNLSNLRDLSLNGNQLTGGIPSELGNLANLQGLSLWGNQLTGVIPKELGNLANLRWLWLSSNQLTGGIPEELGSLSNLQSLDLHGNQLTGEIPPELGGLSNLTWLWLHVNQLTGVIPKELGNLAQLEGLLLQGNQLIGTIPTELGNLSNLQWLSLGGNFLTGCVPDGLRDVPNNDIVRLGLPFCSEHPCVSGGAVVDATNTGLVSDCERLLAARDTLAGTAALNWSADTPIADWTGVALGEASGRVTEILLGGMGLNGNIPKQLGSLTNLQSLDLSDNRLTGSIAAELLDLANLQELYLGGNLLTGCVPDGLRDVPNNDIARLGLPFCSEHPCVSGGAVVDATNAGLKSDCGMLLAARDTLAGTASLNWSADTPITEWNGVVLGETSGRVTEILLGGMGLNGNIPKELGSLANLTELDLADNGLTGEIPPELGRLSNLQQLSLWGNQLTGEIPPELGGLSNLTRLFLDGNQLTGEIPPELGGLSNLTYLILAGNQLTGEIPPELGGLSNLAELILADNQLTGEIPPELGRLSNLTHLILADNGLTGEIPPELGGLSNLTLLVLAENGLAGEIPPELGGLSNLTDLILADNGLTGEIPPELGGLSNLTGLFLQRNQLTGEIPPELGGLSNLTGLWLNDNQLTGVIPKELGGLANLQRLYLSDNRLTGCVPPRLRDVPDNDLDQLGLPFCPLSPPEASTISSVTSEMDSLTVSWATPLSDGGSDITAYDLRHIETDDDETVDPNWTVVEDVWTTGSGALEYTLTGLTVGTEYDIQVRAVNAVGDGPWSVTVTATLTTVSTCAAGVAVPDPTSNPGLVSDCESLLTLLDTLVEGTVLNWSADIPISEWDGIEEDSLEGTPPQVVRLYLGGLGLDGAVPSELSGLTELKELYLQDNDLSGPVPVELGHLSDLTHLHLQNNDLSGGIPGDLGSLTVLRELRLDSNDLSGQLPPELSKLTKATRLWVADNDLSGPIPAELGDMANLDWLNLGRNNFSGQIPAELGNLSRLRRLYIYENDLSGPIPGALGSLSRLTHIVAQSNDLSGEIPAELGSLTNLVWLGLYDNDLSGEIPAELGGLAKLQRLYLTNNELYGEVPEELGDLAALTNLWLNHNYLSGQIPESLDNLEKLSRLRLAGNRFTGCLPAGLAAVRNSDAAILGLPTCSIP